MRKLIGSINSVEIVSAGYPHHFLNGYNLLMTSIEIRKTREDLIGNFFNNMKKAYKIKFNYRKLISKKVLN